jgi:flagellar hook-associated protein 1 FlgK
VAADIATIPGLDNNSGLNNGRLQIIANAGFSFDFLPGALARPTATVPDPLSGAGAGPTELPPLISISGNYSGTTNQTYTCTVSTSPLGQTYPIGSGTMELQIEDGNGKVVKTVDIGQGYSEGTSFVLDNGVQIRLEANGLSGGYFNDGDQFSVQTLANSDTSGFLAAVGINCFFAGTDANSIELSDLVKFDSGNIANSRSVEMTDNKNAAAIAALGDSAISELGQLSPKEYYRKLVVDIGNQVSVTDMQHSNVQGVQRSMEQQRNDVSGVDINEQATLMMLYERMFQAMARYMNTITKTYDTVLTIIR